MARVEDDNLYLEDIMNWISVKDELPENTEEVLLTDGLDSYVIGWYRTSDKTWHASSDMLEADNYDGGCHIRIYGDITHWMKLPDAPK